MSSTERTGNYRRLVNAGDVAIGLGLMVARPAARVTTSAMRTAGEIGTRVGASLYDSLTDEQKTALREQTDALAETGHQARVETAETVVRTVVTEAMSNPLVRDAVTAAVEQAMDGVVDTAVPAVVDQLRSETGLQRLDEMVHASIAHLGPETLEQDLSNAIASAAGVSVRAARGLARVPGTVLRAAVPDERAAVPDERAAVPEEAASVSDDPSTEPAEDYDE